MNDLPGEFARLQTDGYLGDPKGQNAYAYLRASSERQVEEGSSFPRQIENIHKAAVRDHLRISYGMIFFDDGFTGFEFEHRPALLRLRHEVSQKPRAHYLVVEDIDRLSRNSDWQQGFLLDELSRHHVQTHFFIDPGSQLERYVRGYIAQEGMRKDIERMRMGSVYKAMDGRVTARRPKYGYILTDKKNTHYELHPIESKIVREIYERIIYKNESLSSICRWLNDAGIPTSLNGAWAVATVYRLVKSPIYKGEFYANRVQTVKTGKFTKNNRPERRDKIRPKEEWIKVQVPAIVTPQEWDASHEMMKKNSKASLRNGKYKGWLLQGSHDSF
jgi:site-specific DNA recombinase